METLSISKPALNIINWYLNLNIGKKKVISPYFMNLKGERGGLRVMVGKGSPDEIEHEVNVWAQVKGFSLKKADPEQIRQFMIDQGIGIDCSGFVVYVLNAELKERKLGPVWNFLEFNDDSWIGKIRRFLRPVENIGAPNSGAIKYAANKETIPNSTITKIRNGIMYRCKLGKENYICTPSFLI